MLNLLSKKRYYYVNKCPECGSRVTGRYLPRPKNQVDEQYLMRESLKNGELITYRDDEFVDNCYCEDCHAEWRYNVVVRYISKERYEEERLARGTAERLLVFNEEYPKSKKSKFGFITKVIPKY